MIIQTAHPDAPQGERFIITQTDHAAVSGQFAQAFGGAGFGELFPREPMMYMTAHHDDGWAAFDAAPEIDPKTRLPYHLTQTPTRILVQIGGLSPAANEAFHPYSGLLSSMHTYGLYHGRYGLNDWVYIDRIDAELRAVVDTMLAGEIDRQARLKAVLAGPDYAELAPPLEQAAVFDNYKRLQFFDTLALYFQTAHPATHAPATIAHVPRAAGEADAAVHIKPLGAGEYRLDPFPFVGDSLTFGTPGRMMAPLGESDAASLAPAALAERLYALPVVTQTFTLYRAGASA